VVEKTYLGILAGELAEEAGTIDLALSKISSAEKGWRMIVAKKGKPSLTHWERLASAGGLTLVRFRPVTGRTHQIRIHAAAGLGVSLLGDPVYGGKDRRATRTMLHAERLVMPREGKDDVVAEAPLPDDFRRVGLNDDLQWTTT
jgi:tRNA pseudouridine32 synthase/23S rRNA pseudouridine746 synthase